MSHNKTFDKLLHWILKIGVVAFIIGMSIASGIAITALFLGDWDKAEKIFINYNLFHKIFVTLISGFFIIFFGNIMTWTAKTFLLNK
jgi:hypothetical protein